MTTIHEQSTVIPTTPARKSPRKNAPAETWDDDFVFQQNDERDHDHDRENSPPQRRTRTRNATMTNAGLDELNDKEPGPSRVSASPRGLGDPLRAWSESPTSPRFRRTKQEENWDDDFLDKTDSPARSTARRSQLQPRPSEEVDQENWDEDFEMGVSVPGSAGPTSKRARVDAAWDSSDDEGDDDLDHELGFDRDEEDKTVTARSRRRPLGALDNDVPPLPPLPGYLPTIPSGDVPGPYQSPFPRSPSHSVFSIPGTTASAGRDSASGTYGSDAHLMLSLRRTHSAESSSPVHQNLSSRFPPASPNSAPRERRRLRKKSRPPHLDASILELDDKAAPEPLFRPVTPDNRPQTPPPASSSTVVSPTTPSSALSPPTPSSKSPLLTRINSMKRWGAGARRKRASTGPAEAAVASVAIASVRASPPSAFSALVEADRVDNNRTPRPRSYAMGATPAHKSSPTTPSRFFRGSSTELVAEDAPTRTSLGVSRSQSRERERERERLRVVVPASNQSQASYCGESDINASPRKARIMAFGQRLLPGSNSNSHRTGSGSPERRPEKGKGSESLGNEADSRTPLAQTSTCFTLPISPLAGDTPTTRLRPRIQHQAPSGLRARSVFPRHVSGSAVHDAHTQAQAHAHFAPSFSARSASASSVNRNASSDDLAHSDRMSNSTSASEKEKGHRGFMGSMRRISLVGGQKRHQRGQSGGAEESDGAPSPDNSSSVPPLPAIPIDHDPLSNSLLPALDLQRQLSPPNGVSGSLNVNAPKVLRAVPPSLAKAVDLTSPSSSPPRPERLPALAHSKSSSFATASSSPGRGSPIARLTGSPQAASLGRASPLPMSTGSGMSPSSMGSNVHRRNSLGDLKIPSRISRAQDGLKRDLGRVREFAAHVEQMKELRAGYYMLATQVQDILETPPLPTRATSPTNLFNLSRSSSRARSNTNPVHPPPPLIDHRTLATSFQTIDSKYRIAWECADLLIELGTGSSSLETAQSAPATTVPATGKAALNPAPDRQKNRERAVTLAGDEGKPDFSGMGSGPGSSPKTGNPPPALLSWRASTGRHDLGQRQLFLLKEMLNNAESAREGTRPDILDAAAYERSHLATQWNWGWDAGEGMESSLTLPTDESGAAASVTSPAKTRRYSRLGMTGFRDMLRSLTRSHAHARMSAPAMEGAQSSTTLSTESSFDTQSRHGENQSYNTVAGPPGPRRLTNRKKSGSGLGKGPTRSSVADFGPYMDGIQIGHKSSPRRPSLASLFRLGQKHKASPASSTDQSLEHAADNVDHTNTDERQLHDNDDGDDSDWDRMDSTSDIDAQMEAISGAGTTKSRGTLKLHKKKRVSQPLRPVTPKNLFNASQVSIDAPDQSLTNVRSPRLSNVDENLASTAPSGSGRQTPATPDSSRRRAADVGRAFSSVRTVPQPPSHVKGLPVFDIAPVPAPGSDLKLAMTPENIRPLLENARVVTARLYDCLMEVRTLLSRAEVVAPNTFNASSADLSRANPTT
ncbi:hypothetical protein M0805_008797 [Coniferiporia weirii]|nr:hypothetical protein M0805_008797 [Coniferiporia weirii]